MLAWLGCWLVASVLAAVAASLVQTQINLAALAALGAPVPWSVRLKASAHDLASFAPLFGGFLALGLLIALAVAELLARRLPFARGALFPLAGLAAMLSLLGLLELALPVTAIAAARAPAGILALGLCGAFGGWVFERLRAAQRLAATLTRARGPGR